VVIDKRPNGLHPKTLPELQELFMIKVRQGISLWFQGATATTSGILTTKWASAQNRSGAAVIVHDTRTTGYKPVWFQGATATTSGILITGFSLWLSVNAQMGFSPRMFRISKIQVPAT
jgi:hypothetical protein